ncbi:hypothetical protein [Paenibacillus taichungensis]|uniref:hypothetical protein n=1 Tax=Paenibacillus taichungensis TaxID=484184 RepID=UPI0035D6A98E
MKDMTLQDFEQAGILAANQARAAAHKAGTFYSFSKNGKVLREYPDGRITEVIYDGTGHVTEMDYSRE